jgi:cytochrome b561
LVTLIIVSGQFEDLAESEEKRELIQLHSSFGIVFFLIIMVRFCWRQVNLNPVLSYDIAVWQKYTAIYLHRLIYIILFFQCVLGFVMFFCSGEVVSFFEFEIGKGVKETLRFNELAKWLHSFVSILIYPLFAVHISAAIYHQIFGVLDE